MVLTKITHQYHNLGITRGHRFPVLPSQRLVMYIAIGIGLDLAFSVEWISCFANNLEEVHVKGV